MRLKNVLCIALVLMINTTVFAQNEEGLSVNEESTIVSDGYIQKGNTIDVPLITITRATGEIETYGYHDLFNEDLIYVDANETEIVAPSSYGYLKDIKDNGFIPFNPMERGSLSWNIPAYTITYSAVQLSLNVGDTITYSIAPTQQGGFSVGMRNNVNNVYDWAGAYTGVPSSTYASGSFSMAVGGNFSFAIYNTTSTSNTYSGSYTVN